MRMICAVFFFQRRHDHCEFASETKSQALFAKNPYLYVAIFQKSTLEMRMSCIVFFFQRRCDHFEFARKKKPSGVHGFVYICIYIHVYIYTYIYEYIYTYIYIYKCTQSTKFLGVHRLGKVCSVYIYIYIRMYTWCEVKIAFIIAQKEIIYQFCLELSRCSLLFSLK